jgi:SNARE protein 1
MLPKMPQPIYADAAESVSTKEPGSAAEATVSPVEDAVPPAESLKDLLLSSSDIPPPQVVAPSTATDTPTRHDLQSSSAVHEELSAQLAQMATQLKRNALHFSESLVKDQSVVEEAQEKLEKNYGFMKTERTRLRDHGGKSSSTTWLTMGSMVIVAVAFVVMFLIIRLT